MNNISSSKAIWEPWMRRALKLAALGEGNTSPNPLVGCVVLDTFGSLVGEGFHVAAGSHHAEVEALDQAGSRAKGGTLVVTLEPCCHQGKTPPCTEKIINSGVNRVVCASQDPDPRVGGAGFSRLKEAGLEVIKGVLKDEADYQNRTYFFRVKKGRPWGTLKWAMSLDGRTGLTNGLSQWISCPDARRWVHRLRAKCDAVIIGGGTVRSDNPLLTSRGISNPEPLRVVMSRTLDLPLEAQLWDTKIAPTLIAHGIDTCKVDLSTFPKGPDWLGLNISDPINLLEALAKKDCNHVLWECGPQLAAFALEQGCVQELAVVIAPKLLGGVPAKTPLAEIGVSSMDNAFLLENALLKKLGTDWVINVLLPKGKY